MATATKQFLQSDGDGRDEAPICIPASARRLDGFRAWATSPEFPSRGWIAFLDGTIWIDMSPEEFETHNKVKVAIESTLYRWSLRYELGTVYGDRSLVTNRAAKLSTEPDCSFVSFDSMKSKRVKQVGRKGQPGEYMEMLGSPDLVVEIVSRSSMAKDLRTLRRLYHRAGVSEYWLVNALGESLDFEILLRKPKVYVPAPADGKWRRSAVLGGSFRLRRRRDPIGLWQYILDAKRG
jgi:Uma2 family endonuclease